MKSWLQNHVGTIELTREGAVFLILTMVVGMGAVNTGNSLLYLVLALMLSLLITSGILSELTLYKIKLERRLPAHIFADKPFHVELLLRNRKRIIPSFSLTIEDDLTQSGNSLNFVSIPPGCTSSRIYQHCFPKRGLYRFHGYKISTSYPFGFFIKFKRKPLPAEVIVYPKIQHLNLLPERYLSRAEGIVLKQKGRGTEIYNLRDYAVGDDSRLIHWKVSARLSRLLVKEFEEEGRRRVCLVMDHSLPRGFSRDQAEALEEGISIMASLAYHFIMHGLYVQLLTHTDVIPSDVGMHHLYKILRCLALLTPFVEDDLSGSKLLTELPKRGCLIFLFSMDDKPLPFQGHARLINVHQQ